MPALFIVAIRYKPSRKHRVAGAQVVEDFEATVRRAEQLSIMFPLLFLQFIRLTRTSTDLLVHMNYKALRDA